MKKIFTAISVCLVFLMLTGCATVSSVLGSTEATPTPEVTPAAEPAAASEPTAESTPEATQSPEALLSELLFHLDLINRCYAETCGAELGDTPYSRVYTSAQAMIDGEAPVDVVLQSTIDRSNPTDPTDATLYEILNFKTNAEARAYLEQYMAPDVVEALFPNEFLEMNGKLYMVYGSRGYGEQHLDLDSAALSDRTGAACTVTLDSYWFEESGSPCTVMFEKRDGCWIVTSVTGGEYN